MTKPYELAEAELLYKLCQAYQSLPSAGGVLDQDVSLLRTHAILAAAGYFGDTPSQSSPPREDNPLAGIEMIALGEGVPVG